MTTKRLLSTAMIVVTLLAFTSTTYAQRGGDDRDGDGLPDSVDSCPDKAGPRENGGCPLPDSSAPGDRGDTPDRDGDGVPDYVDLCPDQPGTGFTEGCPDDLAGDTASPNQPSSPPQAIFEWGSLLQCMVGLFPTAPTTVNIREQATTSSSIIGQLLPGQQFAPFMRAYDENGDLWFGSAPAGDGWGWVFGGVVANNGQCDGLPMVVPLGTPFLFDIQLAFDPFPDSIPYVALTLENTLISRVPVFDDEADPPADVGQVIESNVPAVEVHVHFAMFLEDGTLLQAEPLLFLKPVDPTAPEDCADIGEGMCLVAGLLLPAFGDEPGQCPPQTMMDSLQTAFPGETVEDHKGWVHIDSMFLPTYHPNGVVDAADYTVWRDGLGNTSVFQLLANVDPDFHTEWIARTSVTEAVTPAQSLPKLLETAVSSKVFTLLMDATEALAQGASQSDEVLLKNSAFYQVTTGDEAGSGEIREHISFVYAPIGWHWQAACTVIGFVPGGNGAVMGDGSVMPSFLSAGLLLPA